MAYLTSVHSNIAEWDLPTMTKVRDIVTQCNGHRITLNDDHTCIARAGKYGQPAVEIIDRRTSLPVHQIMKNSDTRSGNSAIRW
jgi:hypothetical protein